MGGGPTPEQQQAAQSQTNLNNQLGAAFGQQQQFSQQQQQAVNPFFTNQMQQGLPYYANLVDQIGGNTAQAFAPARAQLERSLGTNPNALPSGFAQQARTDLAAQQGQAFDQGLQGAQSQQFAAKNAGAQGLLGQQQLANPLGYAGAATGGNSAIMGAPLAKPGLGGLLGGLAGGLASAIPF